MRCVFDGTFCIVPERKGPIVLPLPLGQSSELTKMTLSTTPGQLGYWVDPAKVMKE